MRRSLVCVALVTGSCSGSGSPIRRRSIRIRSSTLMDFGLSLDQAPMSDVYTS